ncbi:MAG: ABC transporter ATP-binding protein [Flammeovirgaceae bacterium]
MLQTHNLQYSYTNTLRFQFPDIQLNPQQQLLILGESGVGKTTLLYLLAGLLKPLSGEIIVSEQKFSQLSPSQLDHFRGQQIGLIFQQPHFIQSLSILENLLMIQHVAGKKQDKQRAFQLLDALGIGEKSKNKAHQLSQGEQQRAGIALATINRPKLILADEPTASLDDNNCFKVLELLQQQAAETQANLLVITHDTRIKSALDQVLVLKKETIQS